MTTLDFITELFCRIDDAMRDVPKHPQANLYPSERVTWGMLFAIKGVGERACYRWIGRDYRPLFPRLPERTRLFRLFKAQHGLAVLAAHRHAQLRDRLARVNRQHLCLRRDRVADVHRRGELPVLAQEHRARPGQVHRHQGMQQPGGQPALRYQPPKARAGGKGLVEVQGVIVAGQRGKGLDVLGGQGQRAGRALAGGGTCHRLASSARV